MALCGYSSSIGSCTSFGGCTFNTVGNKPAPTACILHHMETQVLSGIQSLCHGWSPNGSSPGFPLKLHLLKQPAPSSSCEEHALHNPAAHHTLRSSAYLLILHRNAKGRRDAPHSQPGQLLLTHLLLCRAHPCCHVPAVYKTVVTSLLYELDPGPRQVPVVANAERLRSKTQPDFLSAVYRAKRSLALCSTPRQ